jgi:hypothetical protein
MPPKEVKFSECQPFKEVLMKKRFIVIALCLFLIPLYTNASAMSIGFDPSGGNSFTQIDHIVYQTDTGLSVGFIPALNVPTPNAPYNVDFILQGRVGTASLGGNPVDISPVPFGSEWTFEASFTETVASEGINSLGHQIATFSSGENLSSIFNMYLDTAGPSNPSSDTADPNTAQGYGPSPTATEILSAHLYSLTSSFESTVPGELGTGSFNVVVKVDSHNPAYLDIPSNLIAFTLVNTGTLNQPSTYTPINMWDGTPTSKGQMFKFDGSTDFSAVPEPGTILLLGLGLLGIAGISRKRFFNK